MIDYSATINTDRYISANSVETRPQTNIIPGEYYGRCVMKELEFVGSSIPDIGIYERVITVPEAHTGVHVPAFSRPTRDQFSDNIY